MAVAALGRAIDENRLKWNVGAMNTAVASPPLSAFVRFSAKRQLFEVHSLPLYSLCLVGALFIAMAVGSGRFLYDPALIVGVIRDGGIVLAFAFAARWIGFRGVADTIEQVLLMFVAGVVCAFCSVILASTAAPLADPLLRRADLLVFGIDRVRWVADLRMSPATLRFWTLVYDSFAVTPTLAMVLLIVTGQRWRAWALLTAIIVCAIVSILFLLIVPAYGSPPFPYDYVHVLKGVRDGSFRTLDSSIITGMVTFPSMHAADAVILAIAFSWLGKWAAPLVVLNVLMFFSAFLVGGHYAIDLVGGGVVGAASIAASLWLHRRLDASELNRRLSAGQQAIRDTR